MSRSTTTDDVVVHPLCDSNIDAESVDPLATISKAEKTKASAYVHVLDEARSASAVTSGLRTVSYTTCSYTSLGALGEGTVKCLSAAVGFLKKREVMAARTSPRADGLSPQRLAASFRFRTRCTLQAALMRGNGLLAAEVGL